MGYVLYVVLNV